MTTSRVRRVRVPRDVPGVGAFTAPGYAAPPPPSTTRWSPACSPARPGPPPAADPVPAHSSTSACTGRWSLGKRPSREYVLTAACSVRTGGDARIQSMRSPSGTSGR